MKFLRKINKYPIPGWLAAMITVLYCETLLHLWTTDTVSIGRFAAVLAFALGFGGVLGQIVSFIGHKNWGKWVTVALLTVVSVFYIVEYFVNDAYMTYMPMGTLLGGAKGVATDFADVVAALVVKDFWRILVMLLPVILYALLAVPAATSWRSRWCGLAAALAAYLLGFAIVLTVGTDASRFSLDYHFDSAIRCFGLNMGMSLDLLNSGKGEAAQGDFVVVETVPPETLPLETSPEESIPKGTEVVYEPNVMDFDFAALAESEDNIRIANIHKYLSTVSPTMQNEYTGLFKGKNLIIITAEAFSKEVIDPELTPTLYRLATKGIEFRDF